MKKATDNTVFYTETMARVFADQRQWSRACEVYRYLVDKNPHREDLVRSLEAVERNCRAEADERLVRLFGKWIELAGSMGRIRRIRALKRDDPPQRSLA